MPMDRMYSVTKKQAAYEKAKIIVAAVIVVGLVFLSIFGTYRALMSNARVMGLDLVRSYTADEERNISVYRTFVQMSLFYEEEVESENISLEKKENQMTNYLVKGAREIGDETLTGYAVLNGNLITVNGETEFVKKDYENQTWYQKIMKANGEVVYVTDNAGETGTPGNVIIGAVNPESKDLVAFCVQKYNFEKEHSDLDLPEEGAYYLFDADGNLLYRQAPFQVEEKDLENYAASLCDKIQSGQISENGESIIDLSGKPRGLYHNRVSNGWLCIMTIPHSTLLGGFYNVVFGYFIVFTVILILLLMTYAKGRKLDSAVLAAQASIQALCNTYYEVYRIDLHHGTYTMMQGTDIAQNLIPQSGTYDQVLEGARKIIGDDVAQEFCDSFSLEHLRSLVEKRVKDYGGDFLCKTGGKEVWMNASLIMDEALPEGEVLLAFRQIDEEKKKQLTYTKLLEEAVDIADANEKSQKQFFSNMSHEMRTPLNIILGMNKLAMQPDCTFEKRQDYQKKIEYSGQEMLALINNILEVSRLEHGLVPLDRKQFNIEKEFQNIVQPFYEQATVDGKQFELNIDVFQTKVIGDIFKVTQILNNLLSNALSFTKKGDKISVSLKQAGNDSHNYIMTVADTGIGMSKRFLPHLFTPYMQEKRFGDHKTGGNGLGMTLVKNLVTQKGGDIQVESELGKGTKIVVTLPFAHEKEEVLSEHSEEDVEWMKGLHILVVDDNELNRELLGDLLEEQGCIVEIAVDGKDALEQFKASERGEIPVIIMDLQMPVMDGCESARAIRALEREDAKEVQIIALTANSFSEDVIRTVQAGMNAHLTKPVDLSILRNTIRKYITEKEIDSGKSVPEAVTEEEKER